jgi:hypothetical protein
MHNIYVTLSQLHFLDELVLRDISVEDICKPTKILKFLWIQILALKNVMIIYYMTFYFIFAILSDLENDFNEYDNIDYWIEDL